VEIVQNKALLLKVRNPHRITSTIPTSHVLAEHNGVYKVMVKFGLEECQVLRNLGIKNVPSPILHRYKWPGMYKPFDHQRDTAAFLSLHRRAYCFSDPGCVDSDTEYLSPNGWVKISEYVGGNVAQYHPNTGAVEFVVPEAYVKKPCDLMVRIKTKYGVDQLLSPEHRVLIKDCKAALVGRDKLETLSAEELLHRHNCYHDKVPSIPEGPKKLGTSKIAFSGASIPTTFNTLGGVGVPLSDAELRVQVAVIADGHFGRNTARCVMRLKKDRKIIRAEQLLNAASIQYTKRIDESVSGFGFTVLTFNAPTNDKTFKNYWGATKEQLALIADEIQYWDSCVTRGFRFSSAVKESADFVQYAVSSTGRTARLLTQTRLRNEEQETEYVVQVRPEKALVLKGPHRNMEYVQSTDGFKYCFTVPTSYLLFRRNGCVFASGNTGKTAAIAWAADYLMNLKVIKRCLVICPLSIMSSAWQADLFRVLMHRKVDVAYGDRKKRARVIAGDAEFVIINFDGVEIVQEEIKNGGFDLIVIDEANAVKTATTKRWKSINSLSTPDTWLWMATGTPASQAPTDAYGLAKMLNPSSVPPNFYSFRDKVMHKITQFKWAAKKNAEQVVRDTLQPAIRYAKEDCLDLPELLFTTREAPLTPQQLTYYKRLKDKFIMEAGGETVTSVNAATNINKLLQVSSGAVYTDDGNVIEFDIKNRYNILVEAIEESTHKVLVFVPFRHAIQVLRDRLTADGYKIEVIDGSVPVNQRTDIFSRFQTTDTPQILLIQPAAASHGVTLHAANTVVWWAPVTSNETYHQANARVHRAGQKNPCLVVRLCGSNVEKKLYEALDAKSEDMHNLLDLYKEELK